MTDVVDWSRTKQVTLSKLAQHTHPCTCTYTQRAQPDLSAWPMCAISKEVFRSYQSSMNTDSEENLRGEWVKQIFPPMCTRVLCFVNSGGYSLRDRMKGERRYDTRNFSVHTRLQKHKDLHTERKASKCLNT